MSFAPTTWPSSLPLVSPRRLTLKLPPTEREWNETDGGVESGGLLYYSVNVLRCEMDGVDHTICFSNLNIQVKRISRKQLHHKHTRSKNNSFHIVD